MSASKQQNSFPLRMPPALRARLEARAAANGRSTNSEIIEMLTALIDAKAPELASVASGVLLDEVIARYGARLQLVVSEDVVNAVGKVTATTDEPSAAG